MKRQKKPSARMTIFFNHGKYEKVDFIYNIKKKNAPPPEPAAREILGNKP